MIADVEDSGFEWFEDNNLVDHVSLIYPTPTPPTPLTAGPSPTPVPPAPTPVVGGRVTLEGLDDAGSCAQRLGIRAAFAATSGLGNIADMRVRLDPYKSCCEPDTIVNELAWQAFEPVRTYRIDGGPIVLVALLIVQFRDDAGRISPVICDTISGPAPRSRLRRRDRTRRPRPRRKRRPRRRPRGPCPAWD